VVVVGIGHDDPWSRRRRHQIDGIDVVRDRLLCGASDERQACGQNRPNQDLCEFLQQHRTGEQLDVVARPGEFEDAVGRAAP
jgi:hypothetical protein